MSVKEPSTEPSLLKKEASPRKLKFIEVRNHTKHTIFAGICRSKLTGLLYIEIGKACNPFEVKPQDCTMVEINEVKY